MTDQYTKMMKSIPTPKTNYTTVACIFLDDWVDRFGIPSTLFTDNIPQFLSNCFVVICSTLTVSKITITDYYPQTNGRQEGFNSTAVS